MSQFAPPYESGDAPGDHQETLTPQDIEAILADFRSWLQETMASGGPPVPKQGADAPRSPQLDLHTLLSQFVALRHEVNLQTKASRAQQEQNAEALNTLERALEELEKGRTPPASEENIRPLLKTLVDLYDNLSLARREVQRTRETLEPLLEALAAGETAGSNQANSVTAPPRRSWGARWLGGSSTQEAALQAWRARARPVVQQVQRVVTSLLTGYTMSQSRMERALQQFDLEAIPTVGLPFDPETMEVLEVVHEAGRTSTEVTEEVRRGYLWRGQLFRCAQVRVARPLSPSRSPLPPARGEREG